MANLDKVAFVSMDVESFYDTGCVKGKKVTVDSKYNCAKEIAKFSKFLCKYGIKATFFVTVSFLNEAKDFLLEAIKDGHEIGLHCFEHEKINRYSIEEFEEMIVKSKEEIKKVLGVEPTGFRAPCYRINIAFLDVLAKHGFKFDSSVTKPNKKEFQKITDTVYFGHNIYEFIPVRKVLLGKEILLSGGGYVRLLPRKEIMRVIKKYIESHNGYMLYLHPFEISDDSLPVPKNILLMQKAYIKYGRKEYLDRVEEIFKYLLDNGYQFDSMGNYINNLPNS